MDTTSSRKNSERRWIFNPFCTTTHPGRVKTPPKLWLKGMLKSLGLWRPSEGMLVMRWPTNNSKMNLYDVATVARPSLNTLSLLDLLRNLKLGNSFNPTSNCSLVYLASTSSPLSNVTRPYCFLNLSLVMLSSVLASTRIRDRTGDSKEKGKA